MSQAPRERYLEEFRRAGFADVRITEERPYPALSILTDAGVRDFLASHPDARDELETFAGSIASAYFAASRPGQRV